MDSAIHETEENKVMAQTLTAFLSGKAIPLEEVGDGVFSEGIIERIGKNTGNTNIGNSHTVLNTILIRRFQADIHVSFEIIKNRNPNTFHYLFVPERSERNDKKHEKISVCN